MIHRAFKWAVAVVAACVVLVLALGTAVLGTERGSRWLLHTAAGYAPGTFAVEEVQGSFLGGLRLKGMRYADGQGLEVVIDRLVVQWQPTALLRRTVELPRLHAGGLRIRLPAPAPDEEADAALPLQVPVGLELGDAELLDLEMQRAGEASLRLDRVAVAGSLRGSRVRLRQLAVAAPAVRLEARGRARLSERLPLHLEVRWAVLREGRWWRGGGSMDGDRTLVRIEQRLRDPLVAHLEAEVSQPFAELTWRAGLEAPAVPLQLFNAQLPVATVELAATAEGTVDRLQAELAGAWQEARTGPLGFSAGVRFAEQVLHVDRLLVRQSGADGSLTAEGRVDFAAEQPFLDLGGRWRELQWPLQGDAQVASAAGEYEMEGTASEYRFALRAEVSGDRIAPGTWELAGRGDPAGVRFTSLRGQLLEGELGGTASVTWDPLPSWQGDLHWTELDPSWYAPQWQGQLSGRARVEGSLPATGLQLAAAVTELTGTLRGRDVQAAARMTVEGERVQVPSLELRSGSARLHAEGEYGGERLDVRWRLQAEQLSDLLPDGEGSLNARGHLAGPVALPAVQARVEARGLRWQEYGVRRLQADVDIPAGDREPLHLKVEASGLAAGDRRIEALTVDAEGVPGDHRLGLDARLPEGRIQASATGAWSAQSWDGRLQTLQLDGPQLGSWRLRAPAALALSGEQAALERACLQRGSARLCTAAQWQRDPRRLQARLEIAALPLQSFAFALPENVSASGELSGSAEFGLAAERLQAADVDLKLTPGRLSVSTEAAGVLEWELRGGAFRTRRQDDQLVARFDLDLGPEGSVAGDLRLGLTDAPWPQRPLQGTARARLARLALVEALIPQLSALEGSVEAAARLSGTLAEPRLAPEGRVAVARAEVPRLGLVLRDLDVRVRETAPGVLAVTGSVRSGDGQLQANGTTRLDAARHWQVNLAISGDGFTVADTAEHYVVASPDLQVAVQPGQAEVRGTVTVPEAHLAPRRQAASVVRPSPDVVVVGAEERAEDTQPPWMVHAQLRLVLGDAVTFEGFGFEGRVDGSVDLVDEPERITIASGTLRVHDASYRAYGQELQVERGRLLYSESPVINPGLDFTAVRQVDDVRVGVQVTGTAMDPRLSLFSVPSMPESDILAYLVVGRPLERVGGEEGEVLMSAATSAGLAGGGLLAERIGQQLGFEDVSVGRTPGSEQPWLTVGKYLSPKLYMSYGLGLFESGSMVTIRYELSDRWRVEGRSGEASGADLIWTIER